MELPRGGVSAAAGTIHSESVLRFDSWAATYDLSQLQTVLYGRVHDAVLPYARRRVPDPGAISRVMAPDALLVVADVCPARSFQPMTGWARPGRSRLHDELPALISASGLRVESVEPIRSVASITDAALVAARTSRRRRRDPWRRIRG
jgi:hypothetical protein